MVNVPDSLEACNATTCVERVGSINKEEPPFLLIVFFVPARAGDVNYALNPRLEAYIELHVAHTLCIYAVYLQKLFYKEPAPVMSYTLPCVDLIFYLSINVLGILWIEANFLHLIFLPISQRVLGG